MSDEELIQLLLKKYPGLTVAEYARLSDYQIRHVLLRPEGHERDRPHGDSGGGFEAFLAACRWRGLTDEQARAALEAEQAKLRA